MKFKNIKATNFLSFHELDVPLENKGMVLVEGDNQAANDAIDTNGAGKSSFISAIFYALYGELPNGNKANTVINRDKGKGTVVTLELEKDGETYEISRGRKKNFFTIKHGEDDLTQSTMAETQKFLDELIDLPKDIFMSTVYFDGHNSTPFSSLTDKQKKEYLESLVNISIYHKAHDVTKADMKEIDDRQALLKNNIANLEYRVDDAKQQAVIRDKNIVEAKHEISKEEQLIQKANDELTQFMDDHNDERTSLQEKLQSLGEQDNSVLTGLKAEISKKQQAVHEQQQAIYLLGNTISVNKNKLDDIQTKLKEWSTAEYCLVCGNEIDVAHKQAETHKLNQQIPNLVETINQAVSDKNGKQATLGTDESLLEQYKEMENVLVDKLSQSANEVAKVNNQLNQLNNEEQQIRQRITISQNNIKQYQKNLELFTNQSVNTEDLEQQLADENKQLLDSVEERNKLNQALVAFSDKGIKSHVLDLVTPKINYSVNKYLAKLTGSTISVEFTTQSLKSDGTLTDKFDIDVMNNGEKATYSSLSSGEKRRVDVAISLALQDLVMSHSELSVNTLFYDELFESLDAVGSENVVELLKERLDSVDSIFVITHNESLSPLFNQKMTVVKNKEGVSHIKR